MKDIAIYSVHFVNARKYYTKLVDMRGRDTYKYYVTKIRRIEQPTNS